MPILGQVIFIILDIIVFGFILICLVKVLRLRKYWSYWEQFNRSPEVAPIPAPLQVPDENRAKVKKLFKLAGYGALVLLLLIILQIIRG